MTMVTVGGVRYREEDAKELGLTADTKAYAAKIADNVVPVGLTEAQFKAQQAAEASATRKASGGGSKVPPSPVATDAKTGNGTDPGAGDPAGAAITGTSK